MSTPFDPTPTSSLSSPPQPRQYVVVATTQGGQATIEFLGVLPFFVFVALACLQALAIALAAIFAQASIGSLARAQQSGRVVPNIAQLPVPGGWRRGARVDVSDRLVQVRLVAPLVLPGAPERLRRVVAEAQVVSS